MRENIRATADFCLARFDDDPEFMAGYLLDSDKQFVKFLKLGDRTYRPQQFIINTQSILRPVAIPIVPGEMPAGVYEVVPHLVILQENLPEGLLDSIDDNANNYGLGFLKIPVKIGNNRFERHTP